MLKCRRPNYATIVVFALCVEIRQTIMIRPTLQTNSAISLQYPAVLMRE
jgi:hypothetical protein